MPFVAKPPITKDTWINGILFKPHESGLFAVSSCGKIISKNRTILKPKSQGNYLIVSYHVKENGKYKTRNKYVHRLVAEVWVSGKNETCQYVNHIDGNRNNNDHRNLEWVTAKQNTKHAIDSNLLKNLPAKGQMGFRKREEYA